MDNEKFLTKEKREELKAMAKSYLPNYLQSCGVDNLSKNFRCLCPDHNDSTPSMAYYGDTQTVHCYGCGFHSDIFGLYAKINGHFQPTEEDFFAVYEFCGLITPTGRKISKPKNKPIEPPKTAPKMIVDRSAELEKYSANIEQTDYWKKRGFTLDTVKHFNIGFCANWKHPDYDFFAPRDSLIIPTGDGVHHYAARRIDNVTDKKIVKVGSKSLFNFGGIGTDYVIVAEGEFDAMSIWQLGFTSVVGLGGVGNKDLFLKEFLLLENNPKFVIIALDNDEEGKKAADWIYQQLKERQIFSIIINEKYGDYKDANEFLQHNSESFRNILQQSVEIAQGETEKQNVFKDRRSLSAKERENLFNDLTADLDNAQKIVDMYNDKIRFITDLDRWALFEKSIWKIAKTPKNSVIYPLVNDLYKIMTLNAFTPDEKKNAAVFKSKKKVADGVELCKAFPSILINSKQFNQNPMLLNCPNGIVDLETGKLHPHDSNLLFTQCTGVEYAPDYHSKTVEDFLHSVLPDEDVLSALLIYLGYCLTGIVREDKALFIHGSGRNGKGTLLNALIRCLGDFGVTLRNSILLKNRNFDNGENATPELAKLEYKRIAILDEIPAGRTLDESKFKNLTGGDHFSVRKLHQDPIDIDPTHKFILSGNFLPEIKDARDIAISERLLVIKFEQSFIGDKCDPTVRENMKKPEALTGLLTEIVGACLKWQKLGRVYEPQAVKDFKQEYLDENDIIGEFIDSNCKRGVDLAIPCQNFIKHFRIISNGGSMSDRAIIAAVTKIEGIKKHKMKYGQTFQGIGWINEDLYTS